MKRKVKLVAVSDTHSMLRRLNQLKRLNLESHDLLAQQTLAVVERYLRETGLLTAGNMVLQAATNRLQELT